MRPGRGLRVVLDGEPLTTPSLPVSSRPSTTESLRQTWETVAVPYGVVVGESMGASTAKPWL